MPAYLVRLIKNRDLVGIFVADDEDELEFVVDECTDAAYCEYVELPDGGVMWTSPAKPIPIDLGTPDENDEVGDPFPWRGASLTDQWWSIVYGNDVVEWTPFVENPPQDDPEPELKRPKGPAQIIPIRKSERPRHAGKMPLPKEQKRPTDE
ncbi:hypothetical protein [Bradyrhizobium sp. MOS002]|uniref:hypothetical protein n=1 Tax=Bradyrhizobium sp. MOS002 TaxID=2133947 RepID=UPI000D129AD2|nr:hypothetical protein [Bradyrhizobium sp. MOS002]PSO30525.1 hypothetical protein C7G41_21250 [Bradyrhizobium sp. MOS002]